MRTFKVQLLRNEFMEKYMFEGGGTQFSEGRGVRAHGLTL